MPRMSRRTGRARRQWDVLNFFQVLCGHCFFPDAHLPELELQQCWEEWHDELMHLHLLHHPGSRPWCWWWLDAPEPRRRIDKPLHPGATTQGRRRLYYGTPTPLATDDDFAAIYESQQSYLRRLRLLTGEEQRLLRAGDMPQWGGPGEPYVSLSTIRQWWQEVQG